MRKHYYMAMGAIEYQWRTIRVLTGIEADIVRMHPYTAHKIMEGHKEMRNLQFDSLQELIMSLELGELRLLQDTTAEVDKIEVLYTDYAKSKAKKS